MVWEKESIGKSAFGRGNVKHHTCGEKGGTRRGAIGNDNKRDTGIK